MSNRFFVLLRILRDGKRNSMAMQHRLLLYWFTMVLAIFCAMLVLFSATGVFSGTQQRLQYVLSVQQEFICAEMEEHAADLRTGRETYFRKRFPSRQTEFGNAITLLMTMDGDVLYPVDGFISGKKNGQPGKMDALQFRQDNFFCVYDGKNGSYVGMHTKTAISGLADGTVYVVTLLPEEGFREAARSDRMGWVIGTLLFFLAVLALSVVLSRRFVRPISRSLAAIQSKETEEAQRSGISEIDALISFLQDKTDRRKETALPDDIADLLHDFARCATALTAAERSLLRHYADGLDAAEAAQRAGISIHTVRKHNANMYQKLSVGSRDEIMLYLELFRRCGMLEELLAEE